MKRLLKPWLLALMGATLLHGIFFLEFKNAHWGITPPENPAVPQLNVTLLPAAVPEDGVSESATTPPPTETPQSVTSAEQDDSDTSMPEPTTSAIESPANTIDQKAETGIEETVVDRSTASEPDSVGQTDIPAESNITPEEPLEASTGEREPPVNLSDITSPDQLSTQVSDQKQKSLLDIGEAAKWRDTPDIHNQAFSKDLRDKLKLAAQEQKRYERGTIKPTHYDITEDADGTKYVKINGVCWKMPEPGAEEEWQVVLSGCSGQKDSFRFELNITTDLLTPEQLQMLPFGNQE